MDAKSKKYAHASWRRLFFLLVESLTDMSDADRGSEKYNRTVEEINAVRKIVWAPQYLR